LRAIREIKAGRSNSEDQWIVSALGPLQRLAYRGADNGGEHYLASFQKGSLLWIVSVDAGKIRGLTFGPPRGPAPQDWINNYARSASAAGSRLLLLVMALMRFLVMIGASRVAGARL